MPPPPKPRVPGRAGIGPFRWSRSGDGERQRARRRVSRPPGNGPARADPQRPPGVVSIRPEHAPSSRLRATRPAKRFAGRVVRASLRSSDVSRPPGNGPARAGSQRGLRVVSIRLRQLLRRGVDYSTSGTLRWSSSGHARRRSVVAAYRDHPATAQREPAPSDRPEWSRYARSTLLRRGVDYSTNETLRRSSSSSELAKLGRIETTRQQLSASQPPASPWSGLDTSPHASSLGGGDYSTSRTLRWSSSGDGERQRARRRVSRPPGNGPSASRPPATAWSGLDTSPHASSLGGGDYSTSKTLRWSTSGDGERQRARRRVSRPPRNGPARAGSQRPSGVVSIRPTELLRRRSAYSTSETFAGRVARASRAPYSPPLWSDWPRASWAFSTAAFIWLIRRWYSARSPASRAFWAAE